MTFTAKHYSQIAAGYEKAAADPSITAEKREEFSRKAEWFRFLAEREGRALHPGGTPGPAQDGPRTEASVEGSANERSFRPFLTSLWVLGGAVYLIATVLFINVVINRISHNPFSAEDARKPIAEVKPLAPAPGAVASNEGSTGQPALPPSSPAPARPHAISPDEPSYEAPGLIVPPSFTEQEQTASAPGPETAKAPAAPPPNRSGPEFKVTGTAKVRNGPAPESEAIGSATVTPAPSTHENTAAPAEEVPSITQQPKPEPAPPASPEGETSVTVTRSEEAPSATQQPKPKPAPRASPESETSVTATRSEEAPSLTSEKPKPAKKRARQKPSEPTEAAKQRQPELFEPDPDRDYADLPEQEDVLSGGPPPRMGFFAKRRMLREGLLSPDFIPPQ